MCIHVYRTPRLRQAWAQPPSAPMTCSLMQVPSATWAAWAGAYGMGRVARARLCLPKRADVKFLYISYSTHQILLPFNKILFVSSLWSMTAVQAALLGFPQSCQSFWSRHSALTEINSNGEVVPWDWMVEPAVTHSLLPPSLPVTWGNFFQKLVPAHEESES